ncbi:MAG: hypothetical protein A3C02_01835 [Candidatus Andersenbacteria bacterium RIFCSPHIGHO2_02_FULL_45_11]|uniref:Uncharacterized protein n=1 Tax=Candidatus Andersenbacteria bacterium RIFCSPHIGHO2_12_FULL_45_11 TaxID=1797281 RepID=A0A1G1X032_9BACT|nr:MAG: hypothetical protein A2805_01350 [Candidatus Andersenbacteria bacterium RIFCSPHIGHO2_01_FULL_46_36]OGY32926.1 MAG: hypothetical protein A3C02_01835 [Candidatus Andersenbacteria bacterium RIFCSPHIGHO2_02_FULL_45_11]OGY33372.1 MAG: hypothetical protein A3D99_02840 [Candidatus Andersenbacteria bacterium RIFCSPHIGHO2_12_FULL_45_11]
MLALPTAQQRSMWLQAHAVRPDKDRCPRFRCDGKFHSYILISAESDPVPDMALSFGYDPNNDLYFITDNTPEEIRPSILQIEYRRINHDAHHSHHHALQTSLAGMPNGKIKKLLVPRLLTFYANLDSEFESFESFEAQDAHAALAYLESIK